MAGILEGGERRLPVGGLDEVARAKTVLLQDAADELPRGRRGAGQEDLHRRQGSGTVGLYAPRANTEFTLGILVYPAVVPTAVVSGKCVDKK